ncbi:hypothetical protein [Croceicoccus estronivorus]|nr:hypothetical protein [Croceicoccus estronivorus]
MERLDLDANPRIPHGVSSPKAEYDDVCAASMEHPLGKGLA